MNEETKYRVETPEEDEQQEKKGFFRPLPESTKKVRIKGAKGPITKFLGIKMYEKNRDILVLLALPIFGGLIDANLFGLIIIDFLPAEATYMFLIPILAAIPVGLLAGKTSHALFGGILTGLFFVVFLMFYLVTPAFVAPDIPIGEFFVSGMVVAMIYFLFVVFASLLGSLTGGLLREFF
ncbi:MAG: hypothetical protein KAQ65_09510 [Candidatus Thorarchaeota archaeon]|nr:hypothetical protein [Candidatus Thorarchaeota archaeon]MCK5240001.1 hypothetical protein [Candidatus Thorarchaeota archaeon]